MIKLEPAENFPPDIEAAAPYSCTSAWLDLCREVYGYEVRSFLISRDGRAIGGFCCALVRSPFFGRRLVSMPFSDEPGFWLTAAADARELGAAITAAADGLAAEWRAYFSVLRGAAPAGFEAAEPYLRLTLDLSAPYELIRANYHINLIKNLRKADKTVAVRETRDPAAAGRIYPIYLEQMRKFGSPPLPAEHFSRLLAAGLGRIYIASIAGADAAFLFALARNGTFYADVNAGMAAYRSFFPKIRLFDETIRLARAEGLKTYDFMRTRRGGGVYDHKKKWGGDELPIKYSFRTYRPGVRTALDPEEARFSLPRLLLSKAPPGLLRAIGPLLRRQAGK